MALGSRSGETSAGWSIASALAAARGGVDGGVVPAAAAAAAAGGAVVMRARSGWKRVMTSFIAGTKTCKRPWCSLQDSADRVRAGERSLSPAACCGANLVVECDDVGAAAGGGFVQHILVDLRRGLRGTHTLGRSRNCRLVRAMEAAAPQQRQQPVL